MINENFYCKKLESLKLESVIQMLGGELVPSKIYVEDSSITGVNTIKNASESELSFLTNRKYIADLESSNTKFCLIEQNFVEEAKQQNDEVSFIVSKNAYNDFGNILNRFYGVIENEVSGSSVSSISDKAIIGKNCRIAHGVVIDDYAEIGDNSVILPNCYIGRSVRIGKNVVIGANSTVTYAQIGDDVEIMHNVSIGQDGFGFSFDGSKHKKIIQLGVVIIGDNVSIGSGVTIDRGSMDDTMIGEGTKIDNLVQIGHNVKIGKHCIFTGQVGISGSTEIGDFVVCGGQTGIAGHLKIGSYNRFAAQSGVTKNIADQQGDFYGMPAVKKRDWQNEKIALRKITKKMFEND